MKSRFWILMALVAFAGVFTSCKPAEDSPVFIIEMSAVSQSVAATDIVATFKLDFTTNFNGATYTVACDANATDVSPKGQCVIAKAGKSSQDIKVDFDANNTIAAREIKVTITYAGKTLTHTITQAAYIPTVSGWTTGNLTAAAGATSGYRVVAPEEYGSYFKWGSLYTYDATNVGEGWGEYTAGAATNPAESFTDGLGYDYVGLSGGTAHPGDPCQSLGANYKTPTRAQWKALFAKGSAWGTYKDINGRFFGANASSCTNTTIAIGCIFLPAYGYRHCINGMQYDQGSVGDYWSSSVNNSYRGYFCSFSNGGIDLDNAYNRGNGCSVRCIAD